MTGLGSVCNLIVSGKEPRRTGVVAESFADAGEQIDISRREDKAATELKGIRSKFVLMVAGRAGAIAALEIVAPKHVKQIGRTQVGNDVSLAVFVDQQRNSMPVSPRKMRA